MTLQWLKAKEMIVARLREPSLADIAGKLRIPYFLDADLDDIMLVVAQELLREIPENLQHSVGAAAQTTLTTVLGIIEIPLNVINIISVQIDGAPAKRAPSVAMYIRKRRAAQTQAMYVYMSDFSGTGVLVYAGGTHMRATAIIEPDLATFQADEPTLPPAYSDLLIERTLDRLLIMAG